MIKNLAHLLLSPVNYAVIPRRIDLLSHGLLKCNDSYEIIDSGIVHSDNFNNVLHTSPIDITPALQLIKSTNRQFNIFFFDILLVAHNALALRDFCAQNAFYQKKVVYLGLIDNKKSLYFPDDKQFIFDNLLDCNLLILNRANLAYLSNHPENEIDDEIILKSVLEKLAKSFRSNVLYFVPNATGVKTYLCQFNVSCSNTVNLPYQAKHYSCEHLLDYEEFEYCWLVFFLHYFQQAQITLEMALKKAFLSLSNFVKFNESFPFQPAVTALKYPYKIWNFTNFTI